MRELETGQRAWEARIELKNWKIQMPGCVGQNSKMVPKINTTGVHTLYNPSP